MRERACLESSKARQASSASYCEADHPGCTCVLVLQAGPSSPVASMVQLGSMGAAASSRTAGELKPALQHCLSLTSGWHGSSGASSRWGVQRPAARGWGWDSAWCGTPNVAVMRAVIRRRVQHEGSQSQQHSPCSCPGSPCMSAYAGHVAASSKRNLHTSKGEDSVAKRNNKLCSALLGSVHACKLMLQLGTCRPAH